jgi:hypothetical protein
MMVARANLSIVAFGTFVHSGKRRGRYGSKNLLQSRSGYPRKLSIESSKLVARWHVSTMTGRVECHWIIDQAPADDCICAGYSMTKRQLRLSQRRSPPRR